VLDLRYPGVLAGDDGAEDGGGDAGDLERHLVLEHLRRQGERHVDGVDVPGGEGVDEASRRAGHHRVLGVPAALAEEVLLVDDLGPRPPGAGVGQPARPPPPPPPAPPPAGLARRPRAPPPPRPSWPGSPAASRPSARLSWVPSVRRVRRRRLGG